MNSRVRTYQLARVLSSQQSGWQELDRFIASRFLVRRDSKKKVQRKVLDELLGFRLLAGSQLHSRGDKIVDKVKNHVVAKLEKMTDPILTSSHFKPRITLTEDTFHSLRGELDGAGGHEKRLHNVFLQDVGVCTLTHVNPSCLKKSRVMSYVHSTQGLNLFLNSVTVDRIEPCVFSQCVRKDFHGVRKLLKGQENQATGDSQILLTLKQYASAPARLFS